jgi:hypothetical protein
MRQLLSYRKNEICLCTVSAATAVRAYHAAKTQPRSNAQIPC